MKERKKLTRKQKRIKNRIKIRTLFLLSITLIFNTYAWFLYVNTVSSSITAHVEAWHVEFKVNDEIVEREIPIYIEHAYPGMTTQEKEVTIANDGEKTADLTYAIKSVRIFEDVFVASDQLDTGEAIPTGATQMTSAALLQKIQNDYPFTINITTDTNTITSEQEGSLVITFAWPYKSGQDALDTNYGTSAYTFYEENPDEQAIELIVRLIVTQHNENT